MTLRRLFMSRKRRATVDYLTRLVEEDRARGAARNLHRHLSVVPTAVTDVGTASPVRSSSGVTGGAGTYLPVPLPAARPRPEPSAGSPSAPVRVLVIDEADVATHT